MTEHQTPWATASSQFPVGMEILHDDPGAVADICFVHGLTGGRRSAWTAYQQSEPWLKTLLPSHLNKVRILSFGYGPFDRYCQDPRPFRRHAIDLLDAIGYYRRQALLRPLFFVAHCIGELVCQEAITISYTSNSVPIINLFVALRGIILISTPYLDKSWKAQCDKITDPKRIARLDRTVQTEHSRGDEFYYDSLRKDFFRAIKFGSHHECTSQHNVFVRWC
ncbi:hypothetical protein FVEN_g948 [Fusarium venenatum]|nr:hypothetical protein FVEN_g948 [Fusarium venenatum]